MASVDRTFHPLSSFPSFLSVVSVVILPIRVCRMVSPSGAVAWYTPTETEAVDR